MNENFTLITHNRNLTTQSVEKYDIISILKKSDYSMPIYIFNIDDSGNYVYHTCYL